jgi:hypothetical protein
MQYLALIMSPYLASHVLNLILHSTHNSYNEGKKNTLVINSFTVASNPTTLDIYVSHKILIINLNNT